MSGTWCSTAAMCRWDETNFNSMCISDENNNYARSTSQVKLEEAVKSRCTGPGNLQNVEAEFTDVYAAATTISTRIHTYEQLHHPDNAPHPDVPIVPGCPLRVQMLFEKSDMEKKKKKEEEERANLAKK